MKINKVNRVEPVSKIEAVARVRNRTTRTESGTWVIPDFYDCPEYYSTGYNKLVAEALAHESMHKKQNSAKSKSRFGRRNKTAEEIEVDLEFLMNYSK